MKTRTAIVTIVALELIIGLIGIAIEGFALEALHTATRFSGRFSLLIFSIIFLFQRDKKTIETMLSPQFYLAFAVAHGIHLLELGSYVYLSGTVLIPVRVLGGFLAYIFIFTMPIIFNAHNKFSLRKISRTEVVYASYLWLIFFLTYLPRVMGSLPNVGGNYYEFVILMIWVVALIPLRFFAARSITSLLKI